MSVRSNRANRKRSAVKGRRSDNGGFLSLSAWRGEFEAEKRSQRLLGRLVGAAAQRTVEG